MAPSSSWHFDVGAQSLQAKVDRDEKENFTVVASVSAAGENLPLEFILTGKAICGETTQIGHVEGYWRNHSQHGWQTSETFQNYLVNLRIALGPRPTHLLLDSYSAHRTDAVKGVAVQLGITLH
jgi:hypothetical protein